MLTENEKKVLRLLMVSFKDYSINEIAKECGLTPNGAYKILKKFEKEEVLSVREIANIKSYKIDFNDKASLLLELALIPKLEGRIKFRYDDLSSLKPVTKACVMFGSYIRSEKANDIDILFTLDDYKGFKKKLDEVKDILPVRLHDVIQTEEDLRLNIKKQDEVILEIIRNGIVLWGEKTIIKVVKDAR
jgi:DNA-binding Lrp family transcriptional regulator